MVVVVVEEGGGVFIMGHMWVHGGEGGGLLIGLWIVSIVPLLRFVG